jgi:hypothetical protein
MYNVLIWNMSIFCRPLLVSMSLSVSPSLSVACSFSHVLPSLLLSSWSSDAALLRLQPPHPNNSHSLSDPAALLDYESHRHQLCLISSVGNCRSWRRQKRKYSAKTEEEEGERRKCVLFCQRILSCCLSISQIPSSSPILSHLLS